MISHEIFLIGNYLAGIKFTYEQKHNRDAHVRGRSTHDRFVSLVYRVVFLGLRYPENSCKSI